MLGRGSMTSGSVIKWGGVRLGVDVNERGGGGGVEMQLVFNVYQCGSYE